MEFVSEGCRALTGYAADELIGNRKISYNQVIFPDDRQRVSERISGAVASGLPFALEYRIRTQDGQVRWIWEKGRAVPSTVSGQTMLEGFIADVTERRLTEEALRESEEKHRLLADNTLDAIWTMNLELKFTYINSACLALTGFTPEEWIGSRLQDHCDAYNFSLMAREVAGAMAEGAESASVFFQAEMLKKNGDPLPVEIHGKVIYDESGRPLALQGVTRDITERLWAQEALRRSEALLKSAQSIGKLGGWEWDVVSQEMYWTEETYRIHDFDLSLFPSGGQEHIARSVECYAGADRSRILAAFQRCVEKGESYELDCRFVTGKGRRLWIRTTGQAIFEKDRVVKVYGTIQDTTEQKQAELRIEHLNRVLHAIRNVNQLIVREQDRDVLIHEGCRLLVDNRGYNSAFIVLTDEEGTPVTWANAGYGFGPGGYGRHMEKG